MPRPGAQEAIIARLSGFAVTSMWWKPAAANQALILYGFLSGVTATVFAVPDFAGELAADWSLSLAGAGADEGLG